MKATAGHSGSRCGPGVTFARETVRPSFRRRGYAWTGITLQPYAKTDSASAGTVPQTVGRRGRPGLAGGSVLAFGGGGGRHFLKLLRVRGAQVLAAQEEQATGDQDQPAPQVEAVRSELFSRSRRSNSLLNREKTGNFCKNSLIGPQICR